MEKYRATRFQQDSPDGSPYKSMISYGSIDEKGADEPDPAYMHHCRELELRNDNTAGDGLNGSIRLDEADLKAVGAEPGDPVKVYAESEDRWILYERDTYTDRPGIGMPRGHREELGLDSDNRTVQIWLDEAESDPDDTTDEDETTRKQVSLTGEKPEEQEYVQIPDDDPIKYHHVSSSDDHVTECGIQIKNRGRRFSDPGDALKQCNDCAVRSSDEMTNKEIVDWLGDQAGFEATEGTPAYLSKKQLVALRDYVLDLQDDLEDESTNKDVTTV